MPIAPVALLGIVVGCGSPGPTVDVEAVLRQPAVWPARPAPDAGLVAMRDRCAGPAEPVVATEDRGFGMVFVLAGTPEVYGSCEFRRLPDGSLALASAGSGEDAAPVPDGSFVIRTIGSGPPWTPERASANPQIEYRYLDGIAPVGTTRVRAVVGNQAVDATLGGRLFVVAWPGDAVASALVAFAADGTELGRLDAAELAPGEGPGSAGPG